jgi:hypothetical protein
MPTDGAIDKLARRLIECFNGSPVSLLAEFCDRFLTVNSAILGNDRRSNALIREPIAVLIKTCRSTFPGIKFYEDEIKPSDGGIVLNWKGRFQLDEQVGRELRIPCTCRVRLAGAKMRELWFSVDEYSMLLHLGKLCSDPGQSAGRSATINQLAVDCLKDALVREMTVSDPFSPNTVIHANIEIYRDIGNNGVETQTFRLEGAGKMGALLEFFREHFGAPVELSFGRGISQGYTTTFRGKIRVKVGEEMHRYDIVCGFVSPGDRVSDCWVKVTPPPTLMECLI